MKEVILNNGTKIPSIGVGVFRVEDANIAYETVKTALSVGYRHVDTAMIYGNEEAVGKAIRDSGIPREEIFLTTKLWNDDQRSGRSDRSQPEKIGHGLCKPLSCALAGKRDLRQCLEKDGSSV